MRDDAPEAPAHPVAEPGDLWVLGRHRLLCGDSTVATDVERVLGGVAPHLMVTDPPYGVSYDPAWRNRAAAQGIIGQKKASRAIGEVVNDDRADWREAWALFPGSVAYIWHAGTKAGIVQDSLAACGFETRSQIIWAKTTSRSAAAITTASTSRAGTWCARVVPRLGSATILRRRCGRSTKI